MTIKNKRICITGEKGFLGKHLVKKFEKHGFKNLYVADLPEFDLRTLDDVKLLYKKIKPDIVVHLAARVGGIGANREHPGEFFFDNLTHGGGWCIPAGPGV